MKTKSSAVVAIVAILLISAYSAYNISAVIASNSTTSVVFDLGRTIDNITYCNSQSLDIYIPNDTASHTLPLVIYLHGGGLESGKYSGISAIFLNSLASAGYAVASVNYRLAPQYKFPAQIDDAKCAVRYLRENAQMYGINSSAIGAFGDSSGGQLVSLLALTPSISNFDVGQYLSQSSNIQAAVDMFGPTNLTEVTSPSDPSIQQVYGNQSNMVLASPSHYVSGNGAPILIIQGVNDTNVPESQSTEFYNQLKADGAQTQIVLIANSDHEFAQVGPDPINPSLTQVAQDMVTFFNQYLKGQ
ncbi:MAG: alpha/beta hydrolase fold domain-containing protein [Nitrososphaerales archaeon]